jgi:hypothetical protein
MHMECSKAERLLGNGIRYSVVVCVCFCFFFFLSLRFHNIQNGSRDQDPIGLQRKKLGVRDRNTETFLSKVDGIGIFIRGSGK